MGKTKLVVGKWGSMRNEDLYHVERNNHMRVCVLVDEGRSSSTSFPSVINEKKHLLSFILSTTNLLHYPPSHAHTHTHTRTHAHTHTHTCI